MYREILIVQIIIVLLQINIISPLETENDNVSNDYELEVEEFPHYELDDIIFDDENSSKIEHKTSLT
ncbi:unnamed protein product [Schistosoma rodhaini]|nr:unnamed protein product [Schistosoma rodhaini]